MRTESMKGGVDVKENIRLKHFLVIQSFAPLFVILLLKYAELEYFTLTKKFFKSFVAVGICQSMQLVLHHPLFGGFVVFALSIAWLFLTIVVAIQYNKTQKQNFDSHGESISIGDSPNDGGATFLVTYVLPLLTDDVASVRGLIVFLVMLLFIIRLLSHSNTFYQNPILAALNYKTYTFSFLNPYRDIEGGETKTFIGITRGNGVTDKAVIKRKYIADGVFMIYNE